MATQPLVQGQQTGYGGAQTAPVETPSFQGDVPGEDAAENPNASAPQPSAPSVDKMDAVAGYEGIGFDANAPLAPPPPYSAVEAPKPAPEANVNIPKVTEDQARQALLDHVAQHCCYGKKPARDLVFNSIAPSSAFHYTLETFAEGRGTSWAMEPYTGQPIDGPMNGPPPRPWDIQAQPLGLFQDEVRYIEVPHTASVKPCHNCFATGCIRCYHCFGRGRVRCSSCGGTGHNWVHRDGHRHHERCTWCFGSGRKRCSTCHGHGQVGCPVCHRATQLKCYIKLTITWKNHKADHVVERTSLPPELITQAQGQMAFKDDQFRVAPIMNFPDQAVNEASQQLVANHGSAFAHERILRQRHQVRIVPVSDVAYAWNGQTGRFWVYGYEHAVHAPDYPQKCCWGCSIL
ncbi:protein SSUH2 homolog [Oscarella lobularis]|uniref:protein SSUH2 homolog n=1 Tax=Oscarella lobularis TaxID=121494 RepID=UPI003313BE33